MSAVVNMVKFLGLQLLIGVVSLICILTAILVPWGWLISVAVVAYLIWSLSDHKDKRSPSTHDNWSDRPDG